jgi:hypothetical protein
LKTMDAPTDSATVTGARVVPEEHTEVWKSETAHCLLLLLPGKQLLPLLHTMYIGCFIDCCSFCCSPHLILLCPCGLHRGPTDPALYTPWQTCLPASLITPLYTTHNSMKWVAQFALLHVLCWCCWLNLLASQQQPLLQTFSLGSSQLGHPSDINYVHASLLDPQMMKLTTCTQLLGCPSDINCTCMHLYEAHKW